MSPPPRYTRPVSRSNALHASLVGLTTLLAASAAFSAPKSPPANPPATAGTANIATSGNKVSVGFTPDAAIAHPAKGALGAASAAANAVAGTGVSNPAAAASAALNAANAAKTEDPIDRARRGVVTLERDGEVLGLGTVLKNDGRILTALSPLGDGNSIDIRYPDNTVTKGKVGHSERLWDLALVVPQVGRWPEGLSASDADPLKAGAQLRAFAPAKGKAAAPASVVLKNKRSLLGADEQLLRDVFEVSTKIGPKEFGSPVVDETGNVVAVLGRACVPVEKGPCAPTAFGVPIDATRAFLRTAPASAVPPAPWLGIQGVTDTIGPAKGVRVTSVSPDSPADEGGLKSGPDKTGDLVVAVDDKPVLSPEGLAAAIREKAVGDRAKLLLFGNGKFRESTVVLRPSPSNK